MQSSWAQHSTVIAQRSRAEVGDLFRVHGAPRELEGKDSLVVSEPDGVWFVQAGTVDLFFVDLRDGQARGRRRHFLRVEVGEIFLALEPLASLDPRLAFGVLAVGGPGTRVVHMTQADLRQVARTRGALDAVHGLVDGWVQRTSHGLRGGDAPPTRAAAQPGTTLTLEPGQSVSAGPKAVWFVQSAGTSKLAGLSAVRAKPKSLLPLTRETWLVAETACELSFVDAPTYYRWDPEWVSLRRFHRFVLDALARARLAERQGEAEQLAARADGDARELHQTFLGLAAVDADELAGPGARVDATFKAMKLVGAAMGITVVEPPPLTQRTLPPVEAIARASRIRTRAVVLSMDIARLSSGPILCFRGQPARAVALLPRPWGGYDLADPTTGERARLTPAMLADLEPKATVLYRPFPARALRPMDLVRFALVGSARDVAMLLFTGLAAGLLGMTIPWAMGAMIDRIIPAAQVGALLTMGLLLLAVSLSSVLLQVARGVATLRMEVRASSAVEAAVWDRLLALPPRFFRRFSAGDLAVRANGIEAIRAQLSGNMLNAVMTSLFSMMNLVVMFSVDAELALVAAAMGLGSVAIAVAVGVSTMLTRRNLATIEGRLSSTVLQLLSGISKLRISGAEGRAFAIWARDFVKKRALGIAARKIENGMEVLNILYPVVMMATVYLMVVRSASEGGGLTPGQFIAFNAAFGIFVGGLVELVRRGIDLLDLVPIIERARPIFDEVPEVDDHKGHPGELRGSIQVSRASFRYSEDGPLILDDVDFDVEPGEFVAIVGSSASGKSTLLRLMLGFETPLSGGVYYDRHDLRTVDVSEVRRQIGVVLQNGQPIAGDLFENIVGTRNLTHEDAWEAARMAGLAEDIERMPMGIHTVLGQGGLSLSGGQRQRLLIARALVSKPKIIFFDEATSALDNTTQQVVMDNLESKATRIVIAHRLSTIKDADKIIVLEKGKVVQRGTYEALMEVEGTFRDMARRQIA